MYCDKCGTEINFVPEFEPEVQNQIDETLLGLADELNKEERIKRERKEKIEKMIKAIFERKPLIMAFCGVLVLIILFVIAYNSLFTKNASYYMNLAQKERKAGNMDEAIEYLVEGYKAHPSNSDIAFRLADYYLENNDEASAIDTLLSIASSSSASEDDILNAYESIVSIYEQNGEYDKITALFDGSDNVTVQGLHNKYVPSSPIFSLESGTYDAGISVSISDPSGKNYSIYYTVNEDSPSDSSILYENEIVLDTEGEYTIKAVCIGDYSIPSTVVERTFVIEKGMPSAPEIMEASGEYNQNTMIVAVCDAGCTIFYTTDGSDPDMESKQYISPITMPVGTSTFKFIAYDSEGNCSEIVEREYHLVYTRLVTTEQAVNNLVNTLVRLDILLDTSGKVRGVDGHYEYIYNSDIEIAGAGEYYVIIEQHVRNDGTRTNTGLMYAVNTHDGSVNRLGYDSSGQYTLITISNR